ncbi:MAG TPA: ATP-dependent endonuclease, partial [Acidimicrobiia bacterium]|nr:ATP-dependent endonuclease [Acidimicrobiia bacterium]
RGLERAGMGIHPTRDDLESVGFFVCVADLEDELIRALGAEAIVEIIDAQGELGSLRILQRQPFHRDRTIEQQLWRFMGTRSGRKSTYARLLVEALDLDRVPPPLDGLLEYVEP